MKLTYSLIAAALACGLASAQTAYTTPVGYVTLPEVPGSSDVSVSLPLDRSVEFVGTVSSVAGSVITITGTPGLGSYATPGDPYLAKLASGVRSGLVALITANTANSVTIAVPAGDDLVGVASGDKISIHKAWTPLSFFTSPPAAGTQILGYSGLNAGINLGIDVTFEYDGTNWIDTNTFDVADSAVLYQGESFMIRNGSATAIPGIVVTGTVNVANSRVVISNLAAGIGQDNAISYMGSVPEILSNSGISAIATAGDQILAIDNTTAGINKGISTTIEFDGTSWIDTNSFDDVTTTFAMQPGVGYLYRRSSTAPAGDIIWADQPTYVPTL